LTGKGEIELGESVFGRGEAAATGESGLVSGGPESWRKKVLSGSGFDATRSKERAFYRSAFGETVA